MHRKFHFNRALPVFLIIIAANVNLYAKFTAAFWGDCRGAEQEISNISQYILKGKDAGTIDVSWQNGDITDAGAAGEWDEFWGFNYTLDIFKKDFMYISVSNHDDNQSTYDSQVCPMSWCELQSIAVVFVIAGRGFDAPRPCCK